jgi:U3 small nucleolar RNA-associated protein 23
MRHLYASASEPGMPLLIEKAKDYERRRCDHRPEEYPEPLSAVECLSSVVDPKGSKTNKHRYVVASQQLGVRKAMREIMGVPLVYINRSVMIMEPIATATAQNREREEREKFRAGLRSGRASGSQTMKRKRDDEDSESHSAVQDLDACTGEAMAKRKKTHVNGPKGPNPLSTKKSKKRVDAERVRAPLETESHAYGTRTGGRAQEEELAESSVKRKRRRKHKAGVGVGASAETDKQGVDAKE